MPTIQELQVLATFDQEKLDNILASKTRTYEPAESFTFANPNQMLTGLFDLYKQGYTPTQKYMHNIIPPSLYSVWLLKPDDVQSSELASALIEAEAGYRQSLTEYNQQLIDLLTEEKLQEIKLAEWAKSKAKEDNQRENIRKSIEQQLQAES
ncbi:hypothetical protein [Cycloclasticus pugetii]|uniref:hypothetical protein n=1 Tax=Cycloclasticus pugetii TaxID=34068 RepID=UPI003A959412